MISGHKNGNSLDWNLTAGAKPRLPTLHLMFLRGVVQYPKSHLTGVRGRKLFDGAAVKHRTHPRLRVQTKVIPHRGLFSLGHSVHPMRSIPPDLTFNTESDMICHRIAYGGLSEWFMELVLKTSDGVKPTVSSNLTASSKTCRKFVFLQVFSY